MTYQVFLTVILPKEIEANSPEDAALNAMTGTPYLIVELPEVWNKDTHERYNFVESKWVKEEEEEE